MELTPRMDHAAAQEYLDMLLMTLDRDIAPLFAVEGGAPFTIVREVLCYIDHLGSLMSGRKSNKSSDGAKEFIRQYLGQTDEAYNTSGVLLYEIYRHGTVHNFAPQKVKMEGVTYSWWIHDHLRDSTVSGPSGVVQVKHLHKLRPAGSAKAWLQVSTRCLFDDLKSAIKKLKEDVSHRQDLLVNWNEHTSYLDRPKTL